MIRKAVFACSIHLASLAATANVLADAPLPDPLQAGWNGAQVCERLHEDGDQRVLRCTFPPGVGHERHFHPPHFGNGAQRKQVANAAGQISVTRIDHGIAPSCG